MGVATYAPAGYSDVSFSGCFECDGHTSGDAAQATVVVMSMRNFWGRLTDPNYVPADFEHGIIDQPIGNAKTASIEVDDEDLSDEDRDLLKAAFGEGRDNPRSRSQIQRSQEGSRDYRHTFFS